MRQVPQRRGVVLTRSAGGLLAGAWLAQRGVDVRVLCVPGVGLHEHGLQVVAPEVAAWLEPLIGALVRPGAGMEQRWLRNDGWRIPEPISMGTQRGALSALHRASLTPEGLGRVRAHLRALSGVSPERVPASLLHDTHGAHQELRVPIRPLRAQWAALAEHVRDVGGDVLEDVEVEELDIHEGRVMGVWSDHGLEHVEEVLWTDLDHTALCALGAPLAPVDVVSSEELVVDLDVESIDTLPALGWLARAGVPVSRIERCALQPEAQELWSRLRVWLGCMEADPRTLTSDDLQAWLRSVLEPVLGPLTVVGVRSRQRRLTATDAARGPELQSWLNSGIVALPGALVGTRCGLVPVAEWLMRLEGRPPAAATGKVLL